VHEIVMSKAFPIMGDKMERHSIRHMSSLCSHWLVLIFEDCCEVGEKVSLSSVAKIELPDGKWANGLTDYHGIDMVMITESPLPDSVRIPTAVKMVWK